MDPVADLHRRLARRGGAGPERSRRAEGTTLPTGPKPGSRGKATVHKWWADHGLSAHPAAVGKRIALALIEQRSTADKLAGILVLHDQLGDQLRAADLASFERLFDCGHLEDGAVCDAFGVQVLGTLLQRVRGRAEIARALATWRNAETPWQRRAACAAKSPAHSKSGRPAAFLRRPQLLHAICWFRRH